MGARRQGKRGAKEIYTKAREHKARSKAKQTCESCVSTARKRVWNRTDDFINEEERFWFPGLLTKSIHVGTIGYLMNIRLNDLESTDLSSLCQTRRRIILHYAGNGLSVDLSRSP